MDDNTVLSRKNDIYTALMNGETVMMDADSGRYYNLGTVGGEIWRLLENRMTLSELVSALVSEYEVTPEQCKKDIVPFLGKMMESGLITGK